MTSNPRRANRTVLCIAMAMVTLAGCTAAPAAVEVVGPALLRIVIQIATGIAINEGSDYVHKLLHPNEAQAAAPVLTITYTDTTGSTASATYQVDSPNKITISKLLGSVNITGDGWTNTVTVAPGSSATIEIVGTAGVTVKWTTGPQPEPTKQPPAIGCRPRELERGQVELVDAGCTVMGDVEISDQPSGTFRKLYDNNAATGLIVKMTGAGYVRAPFGASVTDLSADQAADLTRAQGCSGGCQTVLVVTWPS